MNLMKEHFMNPRNLGKIKKSAFVGKCKSGFCGDTIETYLDIKDNIIIDVKYQACGCWALIGSASILSEYIKGKSLNELKNLSDEAYISLLGEVPEEKVNCVLVSKKSFIDACSIF